MLTAAGVSAPDGNELEAFQTGIWGAFLRELRHRQPEGLDHAWVSFFTYDPRVGAAIFADWAGALPNLRWLAGQVPLAVERSGDRLTAVQFADYRIQAQVILDGTELGDLLALADVPYRWGWEWQSEWGEPSAPIQPSALTQTYPVQAPTWVVVMQDFGDQTAPEIPPAPIESDVQQFETAWDGYGAEAFLNYGRLPGDRFMINWPQAGNDYGQGLDRCIGSAAERLALLREARWHSQSFARFIQQRLGRRYGLAAVFPEEPNSLGGGAFALHPYYRESRRLRGLATVREQDILPIASGRVAPLPLTDTGEVAAIAIGNYANDHHYPGMLLPLQPKSLRWGGRWTGTPFTLPYGCLIPHAADGLLVCEKNIAVSHIANGATRLQPVVLAIGQAAGMAAALCVEQGCQPRQLSVRTLQEALLSDPTAPAAVVPLFNLSPDHPDWHTWQRYYLDHPDRYPPDGDCPCASHPDPPPDSQPWLGRFERRGIQDYRLGGLENEPETVQLVTLSAEVDRQLQNGRTGDIVSVWGRRNRAGNWQLIDHIIFTSVRMRLPTPNPS